MTAPERWLAAVWPVVQGFLPAPPARIVEIGCGSLGGFVPMLLADGYDAVGVDPRAPEGVEYRQAEFEEAEPFTGLDAIVASTSLHHVGDPAVVLDRAARALAPGGRAVVIEWDRDEFDEPTAEWCFERLRDDDEGWLHGLRDGWSASGGPWADHLERWANEEGIHSADTLIRLLDERFTRDHLERGPYLFADLAVTNEEDERAAIEAGAIRATRVDYAGTVR
jgi:SAM-dependent methyltransferase